MPAKYVTNINDLDFNKQREDPNTGVVNREVLEPKIIIEPGFIGPPADNPTLHLNNLDEMRELESGCDLEVVIRHESGTIIYQSDVLSSVSELTLYLKGVYTVSYVDPCTGCSMSSQIEVLDCPGNGSGSAQTDCIMANLSTFPTPFENNFENLTLRACLDNCAETSAAQQSLYAQHFPVTLEILTFQGAPVTVLGPISNLLQGTTLNPINGCYEEIIDLTASTAFPFSPGAYILKITFANGAVGTRIVTAN
jgi:hypothetical protein